MRRTNPAAELAATFRPPADEDQEYSEPLEQIKALSVRIPLHRFIVVEALAVRGGRSKNEMLNELLRVGIAALLAEMEPDTRADVELAITAVAEGYGVTWEGSQC